jgi:hypothetical protein
MCILTLLCDAEEMPTDSAATTQQRCAGEIAPGAAVPVEIVRSAFMQIASRKEPAGSINPAAIAFCHGLIAEKPQPTAFFQTYGESVHPTTTAQQM